MVVIEARGPKPSSELGRVNSHIHLVGMPPPWLYHTPSFSNDPDYALTDPDKAVEEARILLRSGGNSALDATTRDYGRNPKAIYNVLQNVPELNLILVTGFNRGIYLDEWYYEASIDRISEMFAREVSESIDGLPLRAGAIKIGADYMRILPIERKCITAAAQAHLATKAPIVVHTTLGTQAVEILDLLEKQGVDPHRVIFFHVDRNLDPWYWEEVAARGAYLVLDQIGKIKYAPESRRVEFLLEMVARGYEHQILLGTDFARRSDFISYGGGPGLGYLFEKFVPFAKKIFAKRGYEESIVEKFVRENPQKAFEV
jgi:phosphotriesterase-related protein